MKFVKYKSRKDSKVFSTLFSLIIIVVLLGIFIYVIIKWVIPLFESAVSCESIGGYWFEGKQCPLDKDGNTQPKLKGVQGSSDEGYICCFGEEVESTEQGEETIISAEILSKCENNICYSYTNADGYSSIQVMNEYSGDNCLTLYPNNTPKNGEILEQKKVKFTSVVQNKKCCIMQFGGINNNEHTYFSGKNPKSGFKRDYAEAVDGYCKVDLEVDFANIGNLFVYDKWNSSSQDLRVCSDSEGSSQQKAMFKLDFIYWDKSCGEVIDKDTLEIKKDLTNANGYSTLINVKELDEGNSLYEIEDSIEPDDEDVVIDINKIIFKFLTRKNIGSSSIIASDIQSFNRNIYSVFSDADICEVYCADGGGNTCENIKIIYSTSPITCSEELSYYESPDINFGANGYGYKSFDGPKTIRYYCVAYSFDDSNYQYYKSNSNCNMLYLIENDRSLPPLAEVSCDKGIDSCFDIKNRFVCNKGEQIFGYYYDFSYGTLLSYYSRSYCIQEIRDCYYDSWQKQCFDCTIQPTDCIGYISRNTCKDDPCGYSETKGCFWDEEDQKCSSCTGSCIDYQSEDTCYAHECDPASKCYWKGYYFLGVFPAGGTCNTCCFGFDETKCNSYSGSPCHCEWNNERCEVKGAKGAV